jgi:hypothetical protein
MAIFDVAQLTRRGIDFIIVPLHANFEFKSEQEKYGALARLQSAADNAGLRGIVVPVWASRGGKMKSLAQAQFRAILRSIDLEFVSLNINQEIHVGDHCQASIEHPVLQN